MAGSITMRSAILLVLSWAVSPGYAAGVRNLAGIGINCGKPGGGPDSEYFRQSRIMGGTAAKIIEFPYAVSLKDDAGEHFCGGSLVHRSYVVTAAHCMDRHKPKLLVAGDQNSAMMDARTEQHLHVEEIFIHPDYSRQAVVNDIALIKLKDPVEWTQWVQPVCLPGSMENLKEGTKTYLVGWGYDDWRSFGEPTEELHSVELPIVSNDQCQKWMSRINLTENHLCAGHREGKSDGCQGDSGGGLISLKSGHMILSGVMSFGIKCGRPELPGIYTRVQKFVQWIESIVSASKAELRRKRRSEDLILQPEMSVHNYVQEASRSLV